MFQSDQKLEYAVKKRKKPCGEDDPNAKSSKTKVFNESSALVKICPVHYSHKGRRLTMEDSFIILTEDECKSRFPDVASQTRVALFGIMDGHGGRNVADFVRDELPNVIFTCFRSRGKDWATKKNVSAALALAFQQIQSSISEKYQSLGWSDGCCCVLALFINNNLHIANLGDSRAVLCRRIKKSGADNLVSSGERVVHVANNSNRPSQHSFPWDRNESKSPADAEALTLTVDHRPSLLPEKERIERSGGRVEDGRVTGGGLALAVSRSFGDCALKRFYN